MSNSRIFIDPSANTIVTETAKNGKRGFGFERVFSDVSTDYEIYVTALLPLLETILYQHKDATLIAFGAKRTGNIESTSS